MKFWNQTTLDLPWFATIKWFLYYSSHFKYLSNICLLHKAIVLGQYLMLPYIRWPSWFPYFEDEIFYSRSVSSSPLQRCLIKAFTGHYILTLTRMFLSLHRAVPVRNYWISYHQRLTSVFSVGDHTPLVFWTSASLFIPLAVLLHLYIQLLGPSLPPTPSPRSCSTQHLELRWIWASKPWMTFYIVVIYKLINMPWSPQ